MSVFKLSPAFPTPSNPLLPPSAWIQLLAAQTPARTSYFSLATSNASIANSVVSGSSGPDFGGQVELFQSYFNDTEKEVKWDSASTLFSECFSIFARSIMNATD